MNQRSRIGSETDTGEDRLSNFPDEVIHQILSFLGIRFAVQTSILSNRWKALWKTLPFFNFDESEQLFPYSHAGIINFIRHVLSDRDHQTNLYVLRLKAVYPFPRDLIESLVEYAISHNVEEIDIDLLIYRHDPYKLSTFSSDTLKKLNLGVCLHFDESLEPEDCWDLPALTDLHLSSSYLLSNHKISDKCLICLPALTTLSLDGFELPESLTLPALINLVIRNCKLPKIVYDFPALSSLELEDVTFSDNASDFFSALTSLRNLTIIFKKNPIQDILVSCPQVVSITISTTSTCAYTGRFVINAPELRDFYCVGIIPVILRVRQVHNLDVQLWDTNGYEDVSMSERKKMYRRLIPMFAELGRGAEMLTVNSATIEALSLLSGYLRRVTSPFKNLRRLRIPQEYSESRLSTTIRKYLLEGAVLWPKNDDNYELVPVPGDPES